MAWHTRHGFWRRKGATRLTLSEAELAVLGVVAGETAHLIAPPEDVPSDPLVDLVGIDPSAHTPEDPAVLRLFPDAYADDDQASAEFRRFTQRELQHVKADRLERVQAIVEQMAGLVEDEEATLQVSDEDAEVFLAAVNDVRLVLASRLDIVADDQDVTAGWDDDDPRRQQHDVYQWLTWLQSTLLETMTH